jgi:hypothetical protein
MRGDTWVDLRRSDTTNMLKVKAYSSAYFKLMEAIPELRDVFALGEKVIVAGREAGIEIGDAGVESISDSELKRIQSRW